MLKKTESEQSLSLEMFSLIYVKLFLFEVMLFCVWNIEINVIQSIIQPEQKVVSNKIISSIERTTPIKNLFSIIDQRF